VTCVLVLALVLAQQANVPEKATLSGNVVDSITGQPLDKVRIIAEHRNSHDPGASTTTDSKGEFALIDLDPGEYHLLAKRSGYLETYYGARGAHDYDGSPIVLTPGQAVENLHVKLTPFGVIAGTVRDSDGEPYAGAAVDLFSAVWQNGKRTISNQTEDLHTDDLGQFRIAGLKPGRYFIAAAASRRSDESATVDHSPKTATHSDPAVTTFYPGTIDPASATPIELAPGARQTGADITFIHSRLHKVIVHIQAAPGLRTNGRLLYAAEGFGEVGHERKTDKDVAVLEAIAMKQQVTVGKPSWRIKHEIAFHGKLYQMTGNETMHRFQQMLLPIFGYVMELEEVYTPASVSHIELVDILKKGSKEKFRQGMYQHLKHHFDRIK